MAKFHCTDWEGANAILLGGKDPSRRIVGNNRTLIRHLNNGDGGPASIGLRLHQTEVVTYHQDGTCTIYMGGWDSVITKQTINEFSPARVHKPWRKVKDADGVWIDTAVWHSSDGLTPPKIWKCRKCHGTGEIRSVCHPSGYRWWHGDHVWPEQVWAAVPGMRYMREERHYQYTEDGKPALNDEGKMFTLPEMRSYTKYRQSNIYPAVCSHGFFEPHFTYAECYQCKGAGRFDYGSVTIPTPFDSHAQLRIGSDGRVLGEESEVKDFLAYKAELVNFFEYRATILAHRKDTP